MSHVHLGACAVTGTVGVECRGRAECRGRNDHAVAVTERAIDPAGRTADPVQNRRDRRHARVGVPGPACCSGAGGI
eukprot:scaffold18904_cov112-Isochrysis_galbana.AAC.3